MIFQSIRWRLQLWYGLVFLALLAGFGVTAYALLRNLQLRHLDGEFQRRMVLLANNLRPPPGGPWSFFPSVELTNFLGPQQGGPRLDGFWMGRGGWRGDPGDPGGRGNPGDRGGRGYPGDQGGRGNPGDRGGWSNPGDWSGWGVDA